MTCDLPSIAKARYTTMLPRPYKVRVLTVDELAANLWLSFQIASVHVLLLASDRAPSYLSVVTHQHMAWAVFEPALASSFCYRDTILETVIKFDYNGEKHVFKIFYTMKSRCSRNLNLVIHTFLAGRSFYGDLLVFKVGCTSHRQLVNMRSGDKRLAIKVAEM